MPQCVGRCDWPGEPRSLESTGEAAVASPSHWRWLLRAGFDLFLPQPFTPALAALAASAPTEGWWGSLDGARPEQRRRPLLLSFKGTVGSGGGRWVDSRLTASEWAHNGSSGVLLAVADKPLSPKQMCGPLPKGARAHEAHWAGPPQDLSPPVRAAVAAIDAAASPEGAGGCGAYCALLTASSFGFAPGGGGPYSFRLLEVLGAGSVPVLPDDLMLPWEGSTQQPPALAWDECAVRVSRAELKALGEVISAIAAPGTAQFERRRAACARLWAQLAGETQLQPPQPTNARLRGAADAGAGGMAAPAAGVEQGVSAKERFDRAASDRFWRELRARIRQAQ